MYNKINVVNSTVHITVVLQPTDAGVISNVKSHYLRSSALVIVLMDRGKQKPQTSCKGFTMLGAIESIYHLYEETNIASLSLIASPALSSGTLTLLPELLSTTPSILGFFYCNSSSNLNSGLSPPLSRDSSPTT